MSNRVESRPARLVFAVLLTLLPGKPDKSPMFIAVTWTDEDLQMPPKANDRLAKQQIELLRQWIEAGAPWPDEKRHKQTLSVLLKQPANKDGVLIKELIG